MRVTERPRTPRGFYDRSRTRVTQRIRENCTARLHTRVPPFQVEKRTRFRVRRLFPNVCDSISTLPKRVKMIKKKEKSNGIRRRCITSRKLFLRANLFSRLK